jgi:DNA primase catalytic core
LQEREGLPFQEALSRLALEAGVEVSPEAKEKAAQRARRAGIYETAQELFSYNIQHVPGKHVRDYLQEVRGYTPAEIEGMELGAYTDSQELQKKLLASGFSEPEIQESGLLAYGLGEDYQLSILWRDRAGQALGYALRVLPEVDKKQPTLPKYKNTPGLDKSQGLIGLSLARGAESLLLVEGHLDALLLNTKGVPTVALGGTSLSPEILASLERSRTKELILALDRDKAGQEATERSLAAIQETSLRAYVVSLPEGYKDPDELIRAKGVEALQEVLQQAERGAKWRAWRIVSKHDVSTDRGLDGALEEALEASGDITDGIERRDFLASLRQALGLSEEQLAARAKDFKKKAQEKRSQKLLEGFQEDLQRDLARNDIQRATESFFQVSRLLSPTEREVQTPEPYGAEQAIADLLQTPKGLKTGYRELDELISIPPGAITIVAGRPGHGKTTGQLNLLVNMIKGYPDKSFYFYSYEEAKKFIVLKIVMLLAGKKLHDSQNQEAYINYLREYRGTEKAIDQAWEQYGQLVSSGRLLIDDHRRPAEALASTIAQTSQEKEGKIGAIFVDYIQKIGLQASRDIRYLEIKQVSSLLLDQAVETDIPIILGAQLGRDKAAGRAKIRLDNLREAGDIENDANLVLGVYNESVDKLEEEGQQPGREVDLEIHLLKVRGGAAGRKVTLTFDRPILKIKDNDKSSKFKSKTGLT